MAPEILRNNIACNDAMALIDARGDTLWAVEVIGKRIRLIVADPKKVAYNEEYKKLVIALEESEEKCSTFNEIRDLMQTDIDSKAEIIQSLKKEVAELQPLKKKVAELQPLKEENTKLRFENAKLLSEASGASLNHAAEIQTLNEQSKEKDATHEAATQSLNDQLQRKKADYSELQEELRKTQDMNAVQAAIIETMQAKEKSCMQEEKVQAEKPVEKQSERQEQGKKVCSDSQTASTRSEPVQDTLPLASLKETQDVEGNASQEDNAGSSKHCSNCHKRKQISTGEVPCSICTVYFQYVWHCETCNDFLCANCMEKNDYEYDYEATIENESCEKAV